ncbi:MAG: GNAT family N-acetyltransferase [Peptostreptococcaceae bacterium]
MIKNYLQLNDNEKDFVHKFITRNDTDVRLYDEVEEQMTEEIYDFGAGAIFLFEDDRVIGKANVILKECKNNSNAYIVGIDILKDIENKINIIKLLIKEADNIAHSYGAENIYIGLNDEDILNVLRDANIKHSYLAITMKLLDNKIYHKPLKLIGLSNENKLLFKNIHDDVFLHIPNGASISEKEVDEKLECKDSYQFIVMNDEDINIGMLDLSIDGDIGSFDLGLIKEYRGRGYGKRLLDTAIDFLIPRVNEINLLVISKNTLAYDMYKKRGFIDKEIYSYWYDTKIFI